jgi:hypothetical protein
METQIFLASQVWILQLKIPSMISAVVEAMVVVVVVEVAELSPFLQLIHELCHKVVPCHLIAGQHRVVEGVVEGAEMWALTAEWWQYWLVFDCSWSAMNYCLEVLIWFQLSHCLHLAYELIPTVMTSKIKGIHWNLVWLLLSMLKLVLYQQVELEPLP